MTERDTLLWTLYDLAQDDALRAAEGHDSDWRTHALEDLRQALYALPMTPCQTTSQTKIKRTKT